MLSAIGGEDPSAGGDPSAGADPTAPGTPDVKGNPDDTVTRGQADVVMDIAERALSSVGEGRTKEQAQAEFDLEQEGKKKEHENTGKKSDADAAATVGAVSGQPQGGGGPMGSLGGQLDPSAIGGNTVKMAKELLTRLGFSKAAASSAPRKAISFPPVPKGTKSGIVSVNNQPVDDPSASATAAAVMPPPKSSTAPVLASR
jgi:hypothetical protein